METKKLFGKYDSNDLLVFAVGKNQSTYENPEVEKFFNDLLEAEKFFYDLVKSDKYECVRIDDMGRDGIILLDYLNNEIDLGSLLYYRGFENSLTFNNKDLKIYIIEMENTLGEIHKVPMSTRIASNHIEERELFLQKIKKDFHQYGWKVINYKDITRGVVE